MILVEEIEVLINPRRKKHFESLGYEIPKYINRNGLPTVLTGTAITVQVKDLSPYSDVKVPVCCEVCNQARKIPYKHLAKPNSNKSGWLVDGTTLCKKCSAIKSGIHRKGIKVPKLSGKLNPFYKHGSTGYSNYLSRASKRGIPFDLTVEQFKELTSMKCHYCNGTHPSISDKEMLCGIDKKDPVKGYVYSNCLPCCILCNQAKNSMSYKEFKSWLIRISENFLKPTSKVLNET